MTPLARCHCLINIMGQRLRSETAAASRSKGYNPKSSRKNETPLSIPAPLPLQTKRWSLYKYLGSWVVAFTDFSDVCRCMPLGAAQSFWPSRESTSWYYGWIRDMMDGIGCWFGIGISNQYQICQTWLRREWAVENYLEACADSNNLRVSQVPNRLPGDGRGWKLVELRDLILMCCIGGK